MRRLAAAFKVARIANKPKSLSTLCPAHSSRPTLIGLSLLLLHNSFDSPTPRGIVPEPI